MTTSSNVRHSSESAEHYTPNHVVELARETLGEIDLDPASCIEANERIGATRIFTRANDGLVRLWRGRVFLNPPGGRSDDEQRPVEAKCTETGSCGLPAGHAHHGTESSQRKW